MPFRIIIPADKEASVRKAENATEEIQVFTDSSAHNGKVGASTILIRKNRPDRILHFHLGPEAEHTVHKVELVGILLALHLITTERHAATTCLVAVDNQAALKAFDSELKKPGHHLAREILLLANRIQKRCSKRLYSLTLRWTAGHIGISGNKKADREAKKAADRHTSDKEHLPPYLRKPLLINPSAVLRKRNDELNSEWKQGWHNTERGKRTRKIDSTTPSTKFLKTISNVKLSREDASRIAQLRLQHIPLNKYLHKFKRTDKANCPACGEENETIAHFLLHCPMYAFERWALAKHAKKRRKELTIETLLGNPEIAIPLANYMDSTGRFRTKTGEQPQSQMGNAAQENNSR